MWYVWYLPSCVSCGCSVFWTSAWIDISLVFILARHASLKVKVIWEAGLMSEHSRAPSVRSPASRLGGSAQVLMLEMSSPDEVTQVIKGVKGLKSDYYIFNSFGELQREATEHSVSAGGSSRGSALWPSPPLWRYALLFWLLCSVTISCLSQQSLLFLTLLPFFPLHSLFCFPACPPPFAALPLELASTTFLILHLLTGQKINTSFLSFFFLFAHIVMSTLTTWSSLSSSAWSVSILHP